MKQQGDGAGETLNYDKLRVAGHGPGNTRARRTNTANRAPCPRTVSGCPYMFARFPSCGIFTPTRAIPVKITNCNNRVTAPVKPQERQITSCIIRGGQHVRPSHKHCKPCAKHAHAPPPRARTCLRDFHLVEFSHQPVLFPVKQQVETTG